MNRRDRIRDLISRRYGGSQAAFARAIDKAPAVVWQLLSGHRNLGEDLAAEIERKLGLPRHYFDSTDPAPDPQQTPQPSAADLQLLKDLRELLPEQQEAYRQKIADDAEQARKVIAHAKARGMLPSGPAVSDKEVGKYIGPAPAASKHSLKRKA